MDTTCGGVFRVSSLLLPLLLSVATASTARGKACLSQSPRVLWGAKPGTGRHLARRWFAAPERNRWVVRASETDETRKKLLAGAGLLALILAGGQSYLRNEQAKSRGAVYDRITLSATPMFTVTQSTGEFPYMTDVEKVGDEDVRVGYFYTERSDAEAVLQDVRKIDPTARVSAFPLDQAIQLTRKPEWTVGGKFKLRASSAQFDKADEVLKKKGEKTKFDRGSRLAVPIFYNTRLISVVNEEPTMLAFLKYEDMAKTWDTMILETRKAVKGSKGFASKGTEANPESLVSMALLTERDDSPMEPELMDLETYLETVQKNSNGAKSIIVSTEKFVE